MGYALVAGIVAGALYSLIAMGIVLLYRATRVINFAQGEIGTLTLFITWMLRTEGGMPWFVSALAATVAAGVFGLVLDRFVFQRMTAATPLAASAATVGVLIFLLSIELKIWGISPRYLDAPVEARAVSALGFPLRPIHVIGLGVSVVVAAGLGFLLRRTDFGLGVVATSQDRAAARTVGVRVRRVDGFAWCASAVLAALAALVNDPNLRIVVPGTMTVFFVGGLTAAVIGGLTSLTGALLGGMVVGLVERTTAHFFVASGFPGAPLVAMMAVLTAALLLRPHGLARR